MVFQPGFVPTQAVTVITTVASGRPTSITSTMSISVTGTYAPASSRSSSASGGGDANAGAGADPAGSGLSKGAPVGIAVGASVGGFILLATLAFLWFAHRRRLRRERDDADKSSSPPPDLLQEFNPSHLQELPNSEAKDTTTTDPSSPLTPWSSRYPSGSLRDSYQTTESPVVPSELGAWPARPWSVRSELQGSEARAGRDKDRRGLETLVELPG